MKLLQLLWADFPVLDEAAYQRALHRMRGDVAEWGEVTPEVEQQMRASYEAEVERRASEDAAGVLMDA